MILNLKNLNYGRKMLISIYADDKFVCRKLVESDVDLGKEAKPSLSIEIPDCDKVRLVFSKRKEGMLAEPRYIDYMIATIFTLITIFIPKLFTEQYFMNILTAGKSEIVLTGNLENVIYMDKFDYNTPYIRLIGEGVEATYDYKALKEDLNEKWNKYKSLLIKYLIITLVLGAILVIDYFGAIRIGYIGAFGAILIPLAFINYIKLLLIGKRQKEHFERGDL